MSKITVFGVVIDGVHHDTSKSLRGAKNFATRHGYKIVSERIGYTAIVRAKRVKGKWVNH